MTAPSIDRARAVMQARRAEAAAERREHVAQLTRHGHTAREIAAALGVTMRTVERDRAALDLTRPAHPRLTATEHARARALLEDGCSYTEVGRTLGRNPASISYHYPGHAWTSQQASDHARLVRTLERTPR